MSDINNNQCTYFEPYTSQVVRHCTVWALLFFLTHRLFLSCIGFWSRWDSWHSQGIKVAGVKVQKYPQMRLWGYWLRSKNWIQQGVVLKKKSFTLPSDSCIWFKLEGARTSEWDYGFWQSRAIIADLFLKLGLISNLILFFSCNFPISTGRLGCLVLAFF